MSKFVSSLNMPVAIALAYLSMVQFDHHHKLSSLALALWAMWCWFSAGACFTGESLDEIKKRLDKLERK